MASNTLFYGTAASERAAAIDRTVREHAGRALLVTPTRAYARYRAADLVRAHGLPGLWDDPVREFNDFARALLAAEGVPPLVVSDLERGLLLQGCLRNLPDTVAVPEGLRESTGLAAHLLRIITQLKQAAIEPADFRARTTAAGPARPADVLVAAAYAAYQDALKAACAYDVPGLFWQADLVCTQGKPRLLAGVDVLLFDGFDDFTPSQMRLILSAAQHVNTLVIGLNYDHDPERGELFALPARTARTLAERIGATPTAFDTPGAATETAYAARHFLRSGARPPADALAPDLTLMPCAEATHEAECLARRVKGLLLDGVAPGEIAVVYRRLDGIAPTLRAVFGEAGVPVRLVQAPPLAQTSLGGFLLRLLDAARTWEREAVLEVLTSPWLAAALEESAQRRQFPALARAAGIISGYGEWDQLAHIKHIAGRQYDDTVVSHLADPVGGAEALRAAVTWLRDKLNGLPDQAAMAEFAVAFAQLVDALALAEALAQFDDPALTEREAPALDALHGLLNTLAGVGGDTELDRGAFSDRLRQALQQTTCSVPQPAGGVGVYDAPALRNLRFAHVFFAGLNEGEVPVPPSVSAVYGEADLAALRAAGIALEGKEEHALRERLLFQHVLETPRVHLTLSWRMQDNAGREAQRSPLVEDIGALLPPRAGRQLPAPQADSFVPAPAAAAWPRDLRNALFVHVPADAGPLPALTSDARLGAQIEQVRHSTNAFGNFDGVLADPDLVAQLAERFGADYSFSVNRIETYLTCPFRFLRDGLLRVAEGGRPAPEMDPRLRGTLLHNILEEFHRQHRGRPIDEIPIDEARDALTAGVRSAFARIREPVAPAVAAMETARMEAVVLRYLDQTRDNEKHAGWAPTYFEVRFGRGPDTSEDALVQEAPYALDTPAGTVLFAGRIDRVDKRTTGDAARLVDYKTGRPPALKDISEGRQIQLLLYARVLEDALMPGTPCVEAVYLQPGGGKEGYRDAMGRDDENEKKNTWPEREEIMRAAVARAVAGIRAGHFPPEPYDDKVCSGCGSEKACRFQQARVLRKQQARDVQEAKA
ncbi:MAG: PD-(D/E)XK nuclease family protein [Candidatus Hydrogenedentota bacterium]